MPTGTAIIFSIMITISIVFILPLMLATNKKIKTHHVLIILAIIWLFAMLTFTITIN